MQDGITSAMKLPRIILLIDH